MTDTRPKQARQRRMARTSQAELSPTPLQTAPLQTAPARPANNLTRPPSRLDQLEQLLRRKNGASIAEMTAATGWQQHSVRGAMAGALRKKRGLTITSQKLDGERRYGAAKPA